MAVSIINIPNSFIQSAEDCDFVLPVMNESDISFQMHFSGQDYSETSNLMEGDIELFVVGKSAVVNDDVSLAAAAIGIGSGQQANIVWRIANTKIVAYWSTCFNDFEAIPVDSCFRLLIRVTVGGNKYYYPLNCFKKVIEDYISTIQYSCKENSYGFVYCDKYVPNKIRLPFFLSKPNRKSERTIYVKSNGEFKVTKSNLSKIYEGNVDHLPDELHEKLQVALEHEIVFIESTQLTGEVRINEDYEVKWTEINDYLMAPASFKVNQTPYSAKLNNCADCETWESPTCSSGIQITDLTYVNGDIYVQWAVVFGDPIKFRVQIDDEPPIIVQELSALFLAPAIGEHHVSVVPICSISGLDFDGEAVSDDIIISDPEECVQISFGTILIPDANVGQPYYKTIPFTGTLPAVITTATKPAWLNLTLSGNNLILSGTPYAGDAGSNISVTIGMNNCSSSLAMITDTMDVVGNIAYPVRGVRINQYMEDAICLAPGQIVFLAPGNFSFAPGIKVYTTNALNTVHSLKYMVDFENNLWRTNILGELQFINANYCG